MSSEDRPVTLYLRNVPAALVREAKVQAAREGTTLTAVVIAAMERSLAPAGEAALLSAADLRESMEWYEANRARLLRRYRGQYVAIVAREVVGHDADFASLAARVLARFGTKPIFMPRVTEGAHRVRVRSPPRQPA